jgi:hypothetical protein
MVNAVAVPAVLMKLRLSTFREDWVWGFIRLVFCLK